MPKVRRVRSSISGSPSPTLITPREQASQPLRSQLSSIIPTCARSCLATSIVSQYDSACVSDGLACICSNYSSQGYALGELALGCAYTACSGTSEQTEVDSYNVCSAVRNAVSPTHSVLTIAPTATSASPTSSSQSSTRTTTPTPTSSFPIQSTTSPTAGSNMITSQDPTTAAVSATASTQPLVRGGLTSSQTAGVSVGCVGALAILVAVIVYFVLRRKRKHEENSYINEKDGFDFIDHTPAQIAPTDFWSYRPPNRTGEHLTPNIYQASLGHEGSGTVNSIAEQDASESMPETKTIQRHLIAGNGIGGAMSSQKASSPPLRESNESTRTVSQLLPDKPKSMPTQAPYGAHLHPMAAHQAHTSPSPQDATTVFEEDGARACSRPSRSPIPPNLPYASQPPPRLHDAQWRPAEEPRQPALSLQIPRQANRPAPQQMMLPPRTSSSQRFATQASREVTKSKSPPANISDMAQLRHYRVMNPDTLYHASPTDQSSNADPESATPIDEDEQRRRVVPAAIKVTKPTYLPRAVGKSRAERESKTKSGRDSTGSNTSFESLDDDTGPAKIVDERQLSPVQEHSPISGIKYPRIPKSAHRSPAVYNAFPRQVSHDVPAPLRVGRPSPAVTPPRQTGPNHWHHEHGAPRPQIVEAGPLSPGWGPKLTPSRRGEDLYLSVSLASPR